jgi:hypothetical protein
MSVIEFCFDSMYARCISAGESRKSNLVLWLTLTNVTFIAQTKGSFPAALQTPFYELLHI